MNSRRAFLTRSCLMLGALTVASKALADNCDFRPTAKQPLGPFYPVEFPKDSDVDLTRLAGRAARAQGEVVVIEGVVTDEFCHPIKGAIVEIWQAWSRTSSVIRSKERSSRSGKRATPAATTTPRTPVRTRLIQTFSTTV